MDLWRNIGIKTRCGNSERRQIHGWPWNGQGGNSATPSVAKDISMDAAIVAVSINHSSNFYLQSPESHPKASKRLFAKSKKKPTIPSRAAKEPQWRVGNSPVGRNLQQTHILVLCSRSGWHFTLNWHCCFFSVDKTLQFYFWQDLARPLFNMTASRRKSSCWGFCCPSPNQEESFVQISRLDILGTDDSDGWEPSQRKNRLNWICSVKNVKKLCLTAGMISLSANQAECCNICCFVAS